jgi:hypothetical protein
MPVLRKLRKVLLVSVGVVVLLFGALVGLAYAYEEEVLAVLRDELNTHLTTPVQVEGMELTLVKRFPQASLRLKHVMAREARGDSTPGDTLLYAGDLYLEFGLFDLLRGDYTIKQVHGQDVRLYPGLDSTGAEQGDLRRPGGALPRCAQRPGDRGHQPRPGPARQLPQRRQ